MTESVVCCSVAAALELEPVVLPLKKIEDKDKSKMNQEFM